MLDHADLTYAIESELRSYSIPFDRAELLAWAEAMAPHLAEDPDPARWAMEFAERQAAQAAATMTMM